MFPLETKAELRTRLKALRASLAPDQRAEASAAICGRIAHFCTSRRIRRVGAFWPYGSEVDLRPLVAAHPDWTFYFPRVSSTEPPRLAWGTEPLEKGLWGLMEPVFTQHFLPPVQLLLVPGLTFDDRGYRLGYGRGFYDALLDRVDADVTTLGVAFEGLRLPEVPVEAHDLPVDGVATERGITWFSAEDPSE